MTNITASNLRDYFNADAKRLDALDKADPTGRARKTVEQVNGKNPRGQVSPVAIALNNKRRPTAQYVRGASGTIAAQRKADALTLRVKAFDAGLSVGSRGPLSKETAKALGMKPAKAAKRKG